MGRPNQALDIAFIQLSYSVCSLAPLLGFLGQGFGGLCLAGVPDSLAHIHLSLGAAFVDVGEQLEVRRPFLPSIEFVRLE